MILLLSGWSTSGKDAIANLLCKKYVFRRLAFADPLKEMVAEEYNIPLAYLHDEERKRNVCVSVGSEQKTLREVLIQRGQEIRQEHGNPGFFADIVGNQILKEKETAGKHSFIIDYVISDWRLPIELETLKEILPASEILTARVQRRELTESPVKDSQTEHQLDSQPFEVIFENDGVSLRELDREIVKKLRPYLSDVFV